MNAYSLTHYTEYSSFAKRGGFLAETDEAIFIETKNGKRILHFRSTKFPARTLTTDVPDSQPSDDFNLQTHLEMLAATQNDVDSYAL